MVEAIDATELPDCVASSGTHEYLRYVLGLTGLYERFAGRIFSSEDVARGKPAPDLFLHAASTMGAEPSRCVVIEDSRAGVEAARAAGMRVLPFGGGLTPTALLESPHDRVRGDARTAGAAQAIRFQRQNVTPQLNAPVIHRTSNVRCRSGPAAAALP